MAVLFADPGAEYYLSLGAAGAVTAGAWSVETGGPLFVNTAPVGRAAASDGKYYAIEINSGNTLTKNFGPSYNHMIVGFARYFTSPPISGTLFQYKDAGTVQVDIRVDGSGHPYLTQNGTTIGSVASVVIPGGWNYLELEVVFETGLTGSAQLWLNSILVVTISGVKTSGTSNNSANGYTISGVAGSDPEYFRDHWVIDASTGANTTHLGDCTVGVEFPTTAGSHSQWTEQVGGKSGTGGTLTITSVNGAGVYTFTDTGIAASQLVGYNISVTGFGAGVNNITNLPITANTISTFTVSLTTTPQGATATGTFENLVQDGINHSGTWPDGDSGYIFDATSGDISDFAHTALSLPGSGILYSVVHVSYVKKDDAGARAFRQVCISGGVTETNGVDISATNTYLYYYDVLDQDPNTSAQWTATGYNAATFGVKEVT